MRFKVRPLVPALALFLAQASGEAQIVHPVLSAQQVEANRALQPQRVAQASAFLNSQNLGLGPQDQLREVNVITNAQGQTICRYEQTHLGYRVYGTSLTVRVDPEGTVTLMAHDVAPGLGFADQVKLTDQDAILAAHRNLAPQGDYAGQPKAERVIFPTVFAHGFKLAADAKTGAPRLDREGSLVGPKPTSAYVWAYQVDAVLRNDKDGYREMHFIVDANSGQVLRKWDDMAGLTAQRPISRKPMDYAAMARLRSSVPHVSTQASFQAPRAATMITSPLVASATPVAAKGWGHDQYRGLVSLDTIQSPLGTGYDLVDITRATQPHPVFQTVGNQTWFWDASEYHGFQPPLDDYVFPYFWASNYNTYSMSDTSWSANGTTGAGSPTNEWGDGLNYNSPYAPFINYSPSRYPKTEAEFHYGDANGQTAAVGAHSAMQVTYDMYKNVLGRLGLDGQNTSMISVVHDNLGSIVNAHFSYVDLMMHYGDGNWYQGSTDPNAFKEFTSITIGGHEMSHGEMHFTAAVHYYGEGMGLNEANSDIMGMCVEAYSKRAATDPLDKIPEGKADWVIAPEISASGQGLRSMVKPSLDGYSPNSWYSGINQLDGHYSMGVPNRCFYFLSMGAGADSTKNDYSPYLPQGMSGIGIDAAARIWYKAVSEYMTPSTGILTMRDPLIAAATDLYGATSPQLAAVQNALAAVNVGAAANGQGRPLVTFPRDLVDPSSPLGNIGLPTGSYSGSPYGFDPTYYYVPIVPMGERTKLRVNVSHAADTSVTWSTGWPMLAFPYPNDGIYGSSEPVGPSASNGSFDADGTYRAPLQGPKFCMVQATSKADPLEFGFLPTLVAHLDADGDGEQDAVDMGAFALSYGLPGNVSYYLNPGGEPVGLLWADYNTGDYVGYSFDDYTLQAFNEAFQNAFAQ
ncbi:hypothetical protein GETHLI_30500 [Geothrix limicola]|uniref:Uncharacterized protein n=1 Tax=Geothrix limicola TaxID=2927978 RepID=A0ABQ5QJP9_9BACT|nr:M4 family metallopeptidase [Geothrix limicola]GLH74548.1 hypothetical protein GETHLI_30500 [Geothrix limicola]